MELIKDCTDIQSRNRLLLSKRKPNLIQRNRWCPFTTKSHFLACKIIHLPNVLTKTLHPLISHKKRYSNNMFNGLFNEEDSIRSIWSSIYKRYKPQRSWYRCHAIIFTSIIIRYNSCIRIKIWIWKFTSSYSIVRVWVSTDFENRLVNN